MSAPTRRLPALTPGRVGQWLLNRSTIILFLLVFLAFGLVAPRFYSTENMANIVKNASFTGILAVGMTFVLLTAGIDLSVGSNMYLSAVTAGLVMRATNQPVWACLLIALAVGAGFGALNGLAVVRLRIAPFMVTLSTLVIGRGLGTRFTESRQIDFPERMIAFGRLAPFGIPMPIVAFALVALAAWFILTQTPFGRQVFAVGNDLPASRKAGIHTDRVIWSVYLISGLCAGLAGFILASQLGGRVDRSFAQTREFSAIAAAVLGGTSLFGGVGTIGGTVLGALLIQLVQTGLAFNQVNLYLQPMVEAGIIFVAVFLDGLRNRMLARLRRRFIRPVAAGQPATPDATP